MRKLSFRWRITLLSTGLIVTACIVLAALISGYAVFQFDQLGSETIEVSRTGSQPQTLDLDLSQVVPQIAESLRSARSTFVLWSVLWTAVVAVLATVTTYFLAGRSLRPLRRVTNQMTQIEAQNLSQQLDEVEQRDEIYDVIHSFNNMLTRLEASFDDQRRFSAHAAHELRTPLAVIRTRMDALEAQANPTEEQVDGVMQTVTTQVERLMNLVDLLLEMTELQLVERNDVVDMHALIDEVFCDLADVAQAQQIQLTLSPTNCEVVGNDTLLYRAIYNLVENAIKHGGNGGTVTVEVYENNQKVHVEVTDTGSGINPGLWDALFTPFFRTAKTQESQTEGLGLGLALVREIAVVHGGGVEVASSNSDGTTLALTLPL